MLEEMDAATYGEWIAYNSLEPLDPAGALLAGFSGKKEDEEPPAPKKPQTWEDHYKLLSSFAVKKNA